MQSPMNPYFLCNAQGLPRFMQVYARSQGQWMHMTSRGYEKYCSSCNIWRPPRAHHCSVCGYCMVRLFTSSILPGSTLGQGIYWAPSFRLPCLLQRASDIARSTTVSCRNFLAEIALDRQALCCMYAADHAR